MFELSSPDWDSVVQTEINGECQLLPCGAVSIPTNHGELRLSISEMGVRIQNEEQFAVNDYGILVIQPSIVATSIKSRTNCTEITAKNHSIILQHTPFAFEWNKFGKTKQKTPNDGHFVRQFRLPPMARTKQGWLFSLDLGADEAVYGLGEKWSGLNKRGQLIRSYNHDALGVNAEISYKNTPFAWSPEGWGLFVHTPSPVTHAVGFAAWSQRGYSVLIEDQAIDIFLLDGESGAQIIEQYTNLTGKSPVPPLWSLGVILSKAYYKDVPELLATAKAVRHNHMPCDVITLDGRAWQDTDTRFAFEWDPKRFDNPASVINALKQQQFKVCIWEYPLVSVQNELFDEMASKGWLLKDKRTGEAYRYQWDMSAFAEVLTPLPESGIVDFTHPDAYQFWLTSHKPLFDLGIDMIKADFGEQVEDDNMLAHNGDSGNRLHNVYSFLYNKCVYEAAQKYSKTGAFLFSRSAWTGSQRFPSQWGGDPQADWGGLIGSIRGALSWGMSGAPFFATDVGGFYKDTRDAVLFVRWTQAAVFSAHIRLHGIGQRETWSYGPKAESAAKQALKLRYQLMPYIFDTMKQSSKSGLPVMRAMPLAFPNERLAHSFDLQFMFGDSLLVAPCTNSDGRVSIYLPKGNWLRFPCKQKYTGHQLLELTLEIDELAVFMPEEHSIPIGANVENVEMLKLDYTHTEGLPHWPSHDIES
ncbi:MAG: alpha-D-xyloside xylohydrolase [Glaciecola sp.]